MANESKNKIWMIVFWVVFGVAVLGSVVYMAWNRTNTTPTTTTTDNSTTTDNASAAAVDQLGSNEVKLTPANFEETINRAGVVLVDVYSPTCPHCIKIAPILTELSNEYVGKLTVAKMSVAIDENRNFILDREKDFQYVPAVWIYQDGVVKESFTGEKTKEEFKTLIDKYVK